MPRAWAIEGTGGHGAGLSGHLLKSSELVVEPDRPKRSARGNGAKAVAAASGTAYGAHDWTEIIVTVPVIVVVAALVFGLVIPRALRKGSAGSTALSLSVPAVLLTLPAFWTGLPLVLGVAGMIIANHGRAARAGSTKCIAALALGAIAVLAYLAIYLLDGVVSGNAGFLFG